MAADKKAQPESPATFIKTAGVAWILLGLGILIFQPAVFSSEIRIVSELICGVGGSLHLAIADTIKYLGGTPHGR